MQFDQSAPEQATASVLLPASLHHSSFTFLAGYHKNQVLGGILGSGGVSSLNPPSWTARQTCISLLH